MKHNEDQGIFRNQARPPSREQEGKPQHGLGDDTQFELLPDFSRAHQANPRAAIVSRQMPAGILDALRTLGGGESALVAALIALLVRHTGETNIAIGIGSNDGDHRLLRVDASGDPSFEDLEHRVADALAANREGSTPPRINFCLLYTSPSPRDRQKSRMPSSA